jgi:hypothetical protein
MGSFAGYPRRADRTQPAGLDSSGWPRASMGACPSRTNADDRLPPASLGRVEGGDGVVEGRDFTNVRLRPSVPHPLDDLTQLARSDSTTKSTARPSSGRTSAGPTMDTAHSERAEQRRGQFCRVSQRLHRSLLIRGIQEDQWISGRNNTRQEAAPDAAKAKL